ncbi:MAG: glycosyltransferase family 4 protein [Burkholderiaceae bacterium]
MTIGLEQWLTVPVFFAAWGGTLLLRRYGMRKLLDVPNERSSHARPVPRGGGVAIVLAFLAGALLLRWQGSMPTALLLALVVGGGLVAAVGFWDDHVDLPARVRLGLHVVAAILAVALLAPVQHVPLGTATWIVPEWLAWPMSVIATVWLLNLYNFMDGIDGIAAAEAVSVSLAAVAVAGLFGAELPGLTLLAAAAAGFLVLNWPPARIFMGDAGSGFLGYAFAVYLLFSAHADARFVWVWVILLGVFWVDATITLARRAAAGERWYAAHRTHAYQHAAVRCGGHLPVTLAVLLINALVLLPLALLAATRSAHAYIFAAAAFALLASLAVAFGAGRRPMSPGAH